MQRLSEGFSGAESSRGLGYKAEPSGIGVQRLVERGTCNVILQPIHLTRLQIALKK